MNDTEFSKDRFKPLTYEQMYGVEEPEPDGRPLELDIDTLLPFPNQPFHPYKEDEMEKMVESIQENGVISPIVVRPKADGSYEIISGHNRVEACRRAGITQIPSFIREVDDDKVLPTRWNRPFVLCPMCLGFRLFQKQRLSRLVLETAGADRQKESHYCSGEKDACALFQAADIRRVL